ncbi:MAG: hypothetical protein WA971_03395 [Microbacterium sp.]
MLTILASTGRVLWRHWPGLLAWFLAGTLARYVLIEVAGFVGAHSEIIGMLLLPLAVLVRLASFVGMFLVVRDGLRELQAIAPTPEDARERRATFVQALLAGILPFFAIYAAWGLLREDVNDYSLRGLEVRRDIIATDPNAGSWGGTDVGFGFWSILVVVIAFVLRWAWKRWQQKLPRGLAVVAVYLEGVWVFFFVWMLQDALKLLGDWVSHRAAMVWLGDVRAWFGERLAVMNWLWDGVLWLLGEAGGILLQPLAWLTVAGVIYGQAIAARKLDAPAQIAENRYLAAARKRYSGVPDWLRTRLTDLWNDFAGRFRPVGRAILLMWRAGPVVIGTYVLLYTLVLAGQGLLRIVVIQVVGPHDLGFWMVADSLVLLVIPFIIEPLRIAVVSSSYDATLGALRRSATPGAPVATTGAPDAPGATTSFEPASDQGSTGNRGNSG